MSSRRHICVHVLYGDRYLSQSISFFELVKSILPNCDVIFVQNEHNGLQPDLKNFHWLIGSNEIREFSAWQEGIRLADSLWVSMSSDILLLTNDSIFRSQKLTNYSICSIKNFEKIDFNQPVIVGPVEYALYGIKAFDGIIQELVATFFIALSKETLATIGGISPVLDWDTYLTTTYSDQKIFIHPTHKSFNNFYNEWIGAGQRFGLGRWPGSTQVPYLEKNFLTLRLKAKTILLEARLSVSISKRQLKIIDIYTRTRRERLICIFKALIKRLIHDFRSELFKFRRSRNFDA